MPAVHRLIAVLALLAPRLCDACDYCLLGQGISPLQTQTGAGIRVNVVSPGLIWREGLDEAWPDGVARYTRAAPLGRLGQAADVADACLFLVSDAARWVTGVELIVDGGVLTGSAY